jgi:lipopolysaccharide export system permease protein
MRILNRYILKEHIGPFLFGFSVVTFVLVMDFIIDIMDLIIDKGLSTWTILEIFGLNLAWMLALSVPMAVLVATLMAFGRLAADNEITAIKSSGTSLYTIVAPTLLASTVLAAGLVLFNNFVLPEFNHRARTLMSDIGKKRPTLTFKAGIFMNEFPGYTVLIKKLDERHSRLEGITIYDARSGPSPATITAKRGSLEFSPDGNTLRMDLYDGEIHEVDANDPTKYRRVSFEKHTLYIKDVGSKLVRSSSEYRGDREMSTAMMRQQIAEIKNQIEEHRQRMNRLGSTAIEQIEGDHKAAGTHQALKASQTVLRQLEAEARAIEHLKKKINSYRVEIHKKFSIPAACIVFVLIGAPLGVMAKRGGIAIGVGLSLGFFLLYWAFLIGGEELADRNIAPPFLAMWSPNIFIGMAGFFLMRHMIKETTSLSWEWTKRFIPKRIKRTSNEKRATR